MLGKSYQRTLKVKIRATNAKLFLNSFFPSVVKCLKDNKLNSTHLVKICLYVCPERVSLPSILQLSSSFALESFSHLGTDNFRRQTSNVYQFSRSLNGGSCLYLLNHQLGKMIHVSVAILNLLLAGRKHFSRVLEIK